MDRGPLHLSRDASRRSPRRARRVAGSLAVSVVLDGDDPLAALAELAALPAARIDVCELEIPLAKVAGDTNDERLIRLARAVRDAVFPDPMFVYVEVPTNVDDCERALAALDRGRRTTNPGDVTLFAKVRCGGLVPEAIPSARDLARFVWTANRLGVPFKATAGLHHPNRRDDPSIGARTHGFLNVIGGAILASARGLDMETLVDVIADDEPGNFMLDRRHFAWCGIGVDAREIETARASFVHGFGSCSFDEPIEDLCALGILRPGAPAHERSR